MLKDLEVKINSMDEEIGEFQQKHRNYEKWVHGIDSNKKQPEI